MKTTREKTTYEPRVPGDFNNKVAAVLACRGESSRLYAKPMQRVGGKPILEHLIEQLQRAQLVEEIVLAIADTPSRQVFEAFAGDLGVAFVVGGEIDVLGRLILGAERVDADIVVRVTTENPYVYWQNLDEMIQSHVDNGADLTVTEKLPIGAGLEVVSIDALRESHSHGEERHREHCTLFIAENPENFSIQRFSVPESLQRPQYRLTVDEPEDLILVRRLWDDLNEEGDLTVDRIIQFLDENPDIARINDDTKTLHLWK